MGMRQQKSYNQFKIQWIEDERFILSLRNGNVFKWLKSGSKPRTAFCKLCNKEISVAGKGVTAISDHKKTVLHASRVTSKVANENLVLVPDDELPATACENESTILRLQKLSLIHI